MEHSEEFYAMFEELRAQFNRRIPGGLNMETNDRLFRILERVTKEAPSRMYGRQDILRTTYESMVTWLKKGSEPEPIPAPSLPAPVSTSVSVQQKDVLQPHEDTIKYREVEYNLVINSKDRNWITNTTQNRYNFTIQFNSNYRPQGTGYQANINSRIRNITRIEFVKAILPVEGLGVSVIKDSSGFPLDSVLSLPSVNILVDEFTGNNFGTNNDIDKSLAVCQYDSTWRSEAAWNRHSNRGYALVFPKFMKAQRVYSPTPLANLQTLSFKLHDPQGNVLSPTPDSLTITGVSYGSGGSIYASSSYIFLRSSTYFPMWSYSQMDKVFVQGITGPTTAAGFSEFSEWLQDSAGHCVVGIGYGNVTPADGPNAAGYANWIIIQNKIDNPTSGATSAYFTAPTTDLATITTVLAANPASVLNLSRQVQLYIRLITREYDLVSNVRADNV